MEKQESYSTHEEKTLRLESLKREFSHPIPEEYRELAKTAEIAPTAPSYAWSMADIVKDDTVLKRLNKETRSLIEAGDAVFTETGRIMRERLQGDTLIDLGSGNQVFIPNLAEAVGVKRYIGVDIEATESASKRGNFERAIFKDDMLLFVSKLPDNYGSFFVAGAEDYSGEMTQEIYGPNVGDADAVLHPSVYMEQLLREIYRATRPGGLLILGANNTLPNPEIVGFKYLKPKDSVQPPESTAVYIKE